jgi:protein TonB
MKIKIFFILFFACQFLIAQEQKSTNTNQNNTIYMTNQVDVKPKFDGGDERMFAFINANFKKPTVKVNGNIMVSFVVEINGSLTDIGILSDLGHGTGDEAIRVMGLSPNWIPGTKNGVAVRTQFLLAIPLNTN